MSGSIPVVILAGGLGTRLAEETDLRPKPMVEIGGQPILWHIMKIYAQCGFSDFIVALGYKGEVIKRYFLDELSLGGSLELDLARGTVQRHGRVVEDWRVALIDTGAQTLTGGRIGRLRERLARGTFMVTYGDGVANIDVRALLDFHRRHGRLATVTAVRPPARFGALIFDGDRVARFSEKPQTGEGWINGGFMVFEPEALNYFRKGDATVLEIDVLEPLADAGQLMAYRHGEFWQCMDTLRDKQHLQSLWQSGQAPWKTWS
jgi:glucose-1-phosphate cytidylyltransferase